MRVRTAGILFVSSLVIVGGFLLGAHSQRKRLSPMDNAEFTLNGKKITVVYSRPFMRGRTIFGGLVPWNKVWRTGANEATSLTTETDLIMEGVTIPKGEYTMYTIPSPKGWKLIINKQTGQWGTQYDDSQDLARIDMRVSRIEQPVEQFTISFDATPEGGVMKLEWEHTRASLAFSEKK